MSQPEPCGLATSRWSVPEQPGAPAGTASTAGLLAESATVSVLPPVSETPPVRNRGSMFWRSPVAAKPQSLPVSRLWPSEVIWAAPEQLENVLPLPTVLEATIEFCTETVVVEAARIPPAFVAVVPPSLAVIVELVIVAVLVQRVHRLQMAPAPASALLLTSVELSTVRCPTADPVPVLSIPPAVPPTARREAEVVLDERVRERQRSADVRDARRPSRRSSDRCGSSPRSASGCPR